MVRQKDAVGSIFAAIGTALPETLIPIVAIMFGTPEAGVGAIIGGPFMLGTLALFISGLAVMWNCKKRDDYPIMRVDTVVMRRYMEYFLILYAATIGASFLGVSGGQDLYSAVTGSHLRRICV